MPLKTKKQKAACKRWIARKLARQSATEMKLWQPTSSDQWPSASHGDSGTPIQEEIDTPLEMPIEVKEEPPEVESNPFVVDETLSEEIKVEVDLLDPSIEADPINVHQLCTATETAAADQPTTEHVDTDRVRCRFCLKIFYLEKRPQARRSVARQMIKYVLGVHIEASRREGPNCCRECRKMFKLFYDFKRSCLAALTRPDLLLASSAGEKDRRKIAKSNPSKRVKIGNEMIIGRSDKGEHLELQERSVDGGEDSKFVREAADSEVQPEVSYPVRPGLALSLYNDPSFETPVRNLRELSRTDFPVLENNIPLNSGVQSSNELPSIEINTEDMSDSNEVNTVPCDQCHPESHQSVQSAPNDIDTAPSESEQLNPPSEEPKMVSCFLNTQDERTGSNQQILCSRCWKAFETEFVFEHHKPFCIKARERPQSFACMLCPKKFRHEKDLDLHVKWHNGERSFPCRREGCTKSFFTTKTRHGHESTCGKTGTHMCTICAAILKSTACLKAHMANHGERSFVCPQCDKAFHTNAKLKKHSAVHSDERRYQCKVCGKGFKSREANRVHQRIHTQEKPYVCHICGMAFTYNCLLKTHLEKGHEPGN
nr:zinc finger protein 567-like isoform X1 [Aedes albopictus]